MNSALHRRVVKAVRRFYGKQHPGRRIVSVRHVYPRAYVIAKPAPLCIVVVKPWADAETHMREWEGKYGSDLFHGESFDPSLDAGDWCSLAYVATADGGWPVAVPVVL